MNRPTIITLSGRPGSGKSSTADRVAELLGYSHYSSGDFVRSLLRQYEMTLAEFNNRAAHDHRLDNEIDDELRKMRNTKDTVIDARLGFYWIPESFKVYLELDIDVATSRIFKDANLISRQDEVSKGSSLDEVEKQVRARLNAEQRRFQSLYGVNPFDTEHFDLVINTAQHTPQTVAATVVKYYKEWSESEAWQQVYSEYQK